MVVSYLPLLFPCAPAKCANPAHTAKKQQHLVSPLKRPRSGCSCKRRPSPGISLGPSTVACSAPPPPSPRRKAPPRSGRASSLACQCIYGGLRIGLYEPVKSFYVGENDVGDVPLYKKIAAGFTTGALAIAVANPTNLVKLRLQFAGSRHLVCHAVILILGQWMLMPRLLGRKGSLLCGLALVRTLHVMPS